MDYLSSLGVKTIVLSNILKVSDKNSDGIDEFKMIAPSYGTVEDLKLLISAAKERGQWTGRPITGVMYCLQNFEFVSQAEHRSKQ